PVSSANAATTIGVAGPASGGCDSIEGGAVQDGTPTETIPSDGVITSYSSANFSGTGHLRLLILRHVSGTNYNVVAKSGFGTFPPPAVNPFPARLSVQAGELIGDYGSFCASNLSGATFHYFTGADPAVGTDQGFGAFAQFSARSDLSAQLEPDADHDGYGDETQDQCPTNPTTQGPCPGQRAAALKKCKKKHSARARRRCKRRAKLLPV